MHVERIKKALTVLKAGRDPVHRYWQKELATKTNTLPN
jgi:hypothetical protein